TRRSCAAFSSVIGLNGGLFSSACNAMPSSKSPNDMSRYSARPFSTFNRRFSRRTPVWMRSTSRTGTCLDDFFPAIETSKSTERNTASHDCKNFAYDVPWYRGNNMGTICAAHLSLPACRGCASSFPLFYAAIPLCQHRPLLRFVASISTRRVHRCSPYSQLRANVHGCRDGTPRY